MRDGEASINICGKMRLWKYRGMWLFVVMEVSGRAENGGNATERVKAYHSRSHSFYNYISENKYKYANIIYFLYMYLHICILLLIDSYIALLSITLHLCEQPYVAL